MSKIINWFIILLLFWSIFIEPNLINVKNVYIKDDQLVGMKIVYLSDLHYRKHDELKLKRIIQKVNQNKPDLILFGGDFVNSFDNDKELNIKKIKSYISLLKSNYGIYAILGNHDENINDLDIKILNNSNIYIKNKNLYIIGVEDETIGSPNLDLAFNGTNIPRILLIHNPDLYPIINEKVNLVLAGHNHGGQINIPIIGPLFIPAKTGRKYLYGFYDDKYKKMFVTRGLGTSILPIRFNCPPEIVVVNFIK